MLTLTPRINLETPINLTCIFFWQWEEAGEATHTQGEHANSTQKGPSRDLNQEASCCEATVLLAVFFIFSTFYIFPLGELLF